jgi:uncharacterized protein (TIGR00730 family)
MDSKGLALARTAAHVCVFGGSRSGTVPEFATFAYDLGVALGRNGHSLIYGAGPEGLMHAVAQGVWDQGGDVSGVIPSYLAALETGRDDRVALQMVTDLHDRKRLMTQDADAIIALPGGLGTLDELFDTLAGYQLNQHGKRVIVCNIADFYTPLQELLEHVFQHGFASASDGDGGLIFCTTLGEVLEVLAEASQAYRRPGSV